MPEASVEAPEAVKQERLYQRLMRHMPQQAKIKFSWRRVQSLS